MHACMMSCATRCFIMHARYIPPACELAQIKQGRCFNLLQLYIYMLSADHRHIHTANKGTLALLGAEQLSAKQVSVIYI
jgi:hypothetical protein